MDKAEKTLVFVDCKDQDIAGKQLDFEHAKKLFALQHKQGRHNWALSPNQNFELKNGDLIKCGNPANPARKAKAGRT